MLEGFGPDGAADVVDQHVEAAETLDGGGHDAFAFGVLLKVGGQGQHRVLGGQFGLEFEHQFGAVHQDQAGALLGQALGDTPADALGGAGDQGDFVWEAVHGDLGG